MIKVPLSQIQVTSTCVQLIGRVVYYYVDSAIEIKYKAEALDTKQYNSVLHAVRIPLDCKTPAWGAKMSYTNTRPPLEGSEAC